MSMFPLASPCTDVCAPDCTGVADRWIAYGCLSLHVISCRACLPCYRTARSALLGSRCRHCALLVAEMCTRDDAGIVIWDSAWDSGAATYVGLPDGSHPVYCAPYVSQAMSSVMAAPGVLAPASTSEAKTRGFIKLQQALWGKKLRKW